MGRNCFSWFCKRFSGCKSPIRGYSLSALTLILLQRETILMPYLRSLSAFRDEVRKLALGGANSKDILELCDRLRDNELVDLGVALDDQEGRLLELQSGD